MSEEVRKERDFIKNIIRPKGKDFLEFIGFFTAVVFLSSIFFLNFEDNFTKTKFVTTASVLFSLSIVAIIIVLALVEIRCRKIKKNDLKKINYTHIIIVISIISIFCSLIGYSQYFDKTPDPFIGNSFKIFYYGFLIILIVLSAVFTIIKVIDLIKELPITLIAAILIFTVMAMSGSALFVIQNLPKLLQANCSSYSQYEDRADFGLLL